MIDRFTNVKWAKITNNSLQHRSTGNVTDQGTQFGDHDDADKTVPVKSPFVLVVGRRQKRIELPCGKLTLGRHPKHCQVIFTNITVSRKHCRLIVSKASVTVIDKNARNGKFVNCEKIEKKLLQIGDTLKIGSVTMLLQKNPNVNSSMDESIYDLSASDEWAPIIEEDPSGNDESSPLKRKEEEPATDEGDIPPDVLNTLLDFDDD